MFYSDYFFKINTIYLDNAASTQVPIKTIEDTNEYYKHGHSNIYRSNGRLSIENSDYVYNVRNNIKKFINAQEDSEIIFTSGATQGLNLLAFGLGESILNYEDEVVITNSDHHSNIVPWQVICNKKLAILKHYDIDESGIIDLDKLIALLTPQTKILTLPFISNVLGIINPIKEITKICHDRGIIVIVDTAQAVGHMAIDVNDLDIDFLVTSGHKMYAYPGIGFIYGKKQYLNIISPYYFGGGMIKSINNGTYIYDNIPYKFEAGTQNIIGIRSLNLAIEFINQIDITNVYSHLKSLTTYLINELRNIESINIIADNIDHHLGIVSFVSTKIHHYDIEMFLSNENIQVRSGHCCALKLMNSLNINGVVRVSLGIYNTQEHIDNLIKNIKTIINH